MWTTAFALPHTTRRSDVRDSNHAATVLPRKVSRSDRDSRQQHHDIAVSARDRRCESNRHISSQNSVSFLDCALFVTLTLSSRDSIARF
jgi:hypothetical protein